MTPERIKLGEVRDRCEKATPGPWVVQNESRMQNSRINAEIGGPGHTVATVWDCLSNCRHAETKISAKADREFIAASRTDLPALEAVVREFCDAWDELPLKSSMEEMEKFMRRISAARDRIDLE